MLKLFGVPGPLTVNCSSATGQFKQRIRRDFDVGPFKITGLDYAVESLRQLFSDVQEENATLYDQVRHEGMLCVRSRRYNTAHYSNHSWGTAIDIFFGTGVVSQGRHVAHRGNLLLAPYFNRYGWYWGAGFCGDSVDSMHFELAEETVHKIPDRAMFGDEVEVAEVRYRPDAAAGAVLNDIIGLIDRAKTVSHHFRGVDFLGTLPGGQLYFDSELQLDTDGWPDGKGMGDPCWQPETSFTYADSTPINANRVPFFVLPLPKAWPAQFDIELGDLAAVVFKDRVAFASFADEGPRNKLGEGSIELLRRLGEERLKPNGRVINKGMGPGVITIVFPGSRPSAHPKDEAALLKSIEEEGARLFVELGGSIPATS